MLMVRTTENRVLVGAPVEEDKSLADWVRVAALCSLCEQLRSAKRASKRTTLKRQIISWMKPLDHLEIKGLCFIQMVQKPSVHCGSCTNVMLYKPDVEVIFDERS